MANLGDSGIPPHTVTDRFTRRYDARNGRGSSGGNRSTGRRHSVIRGGNLESRTFMNLALPNWGRLNYAADPLTQPLAHPLVSRRSRATKMWLASVQRGLRCTPEANDRGAGGAGRTGLHRLLQRGKFS